jgi:hypothetical protein
MYSNSCTRSLYSSNPISEVHGLAVFLKSSGRRKANVADLALEIRTVSPRPWWVIKVLELSNQMSVWCHCGILRDFRGGVLGKSLVNALSASAEEEHSICNF